MTTKPMKDKLENFERAFSSNVSGCVRDCHCGKTFYDCANSCGWEEGEFEKLDADPKATGLDYSVSTILLEGKEYVMDCECWKPRAEQIIKFIESHGHQIAEYFKREKARLAEIAKHAPEVEVP